MTISTTHEDEELPDDYIDYARQDGELPDDYRLRARTRGFLMTISTTHDRRGASC